MCIFALNEDCTAFCVLFSPCVYSRASTVTYIIFVTVTKSIHIQYRCIYTVSYPEVVLQEGFSLLHMIVFGMFLCFCFVSVVFYSRTGFYNCTLDVKGKTM